MKVRELLRVLNDDGWYQVRIRLIQEAIEFHIEGLKKHGDPVPEPASSIEFVEVAA